MKQVTGHLVGAERGPALVHGPQHLVGVLEIVVLNRKRGPRPRGDLVERDFTATSLNEPWLTNITPNTPLPKGGSGSTG